jgi:DNA-binding transcriptional regulator YdaS (Cro superfamily)
MLRSMTIIERVIDRAGGISALAARLGVKPPTVHQWKKGDRKVSPRLALLIAREWPDEATVHDLRPDIFGPARTDEQAA